MFDIIVNPFLSIETIFRHAIVQRLALWKSVHVGLFHTCTLFCTFLRRGQRHADAGSSWRVPSPVGVFPKPVVSWWSRGWCA